MSGKLIYTYLDISARGLPARHLLAHAKSNAVQKNFIAAISHKDPKVDMSNHSMTAWLPLRVQSAPCLEKRFFLVIKKLHQSSEHPNLVIVFHQKILILVKNRQKWPIFVKNIDILTIFGGSFRLSKYVTFFAEKICYFLFAQ